MSSCALEVLVWSVHTVCLNHIQRGIKTDISLWFWAFSWCSEFTGVHKVSGSVMFVYGNVILVAHNFPQTLAWPTAQKCFSTFFTWQALMRRPWGFCSLYFPHCMCMSLIFFHILLKSRDVFSLSEHAWEWVAFQGIIYQYHRWFTRFIACICH